MPKVGTVALAMTLFLILTLGITGSLHQPTPRPEATVVVIDAGHGGHDPGAIVGGVQEKDVVLSIALRVQSLAQWNPNLKVVLTRSTDRYVDLTARAALPGGVGAVLYVSIHANSNPDAKLCGVETLVDTSRPTTDPSSALAAAVQHAVCRATGATNLGVRRQSLYTRQVRAPAVLVEVGYLTCAAERSRLTAAAYQEQIARGILDGILAFLGTR